MAIGTCLVPVDLEGGKLGQSFAPLPPLFQTAYRGQRTPDRESEIGSMLGHRDHQ